MPIVRKYSLASAITFVLILHPFLDVLAADDSETRPRQSGESRSGPARKPGGPKIGKPQISDTVRANIYADNWFQMYINGNLVAVDSISFIPHNVVSVDLLPEYPMTIAVMAKDNADTDSGLEYDDAKIGDGGFILKFGDGTVTDAFWKAKSFFHGPVDGDIENPRTEHHPIPPDWFVPAFDDSAWSNAVEHSEEAVAPKSPYYENDFAGARWIWTEDLALDNTVIFRTTIIRPPNGDPLPENWPRGTIDESNRSQFGRDPGLVDAETKHGISGEKRKTTPR